MERVRCLRADLQPAPGRLGHQPAGIMTGAGGASLDGDRQGGCNGRLNSARSFAPRLGRAFGPNAPAKSPEAWPGSHHGTTTPMAQSRGGTPTGVRATLSRAPHPGRGFAPRQRQPVRDAEVTTLRLSAFRFPFFFVAS